MEEHFQWRYGIAIKLPCSTNYRSDGSIRMEEFEELDEFNSEEISEVLELAKEGDWAQVKTEEIINELKLHDSKGIEFTIPF